MKVDSQRIIHYYTILIVGILFQFLSVVQSQNLDWERLNGPNIWIDALAVSPQGYLFFSHGSGYITYTNDHGNSYIEPRDRPLGDKVLALVFSSSGNLYCGMKWDGLVWSNDLGKTWMGGLSGDTGWKYLLVSSIAIHPGGIIFAKTDTKGIQRSSDSGVTWSRVGGASGFMFSGSIGITTQGDVFASSNDSIFISTDQGDTWAYLNSIPTRSVRIFLSSSKEHLLAGTLEGDIYHSSDGGNSWINVYDNPQVSRINDMVADTSGSVFAATEGNGILRSGDYGMTWQLENSGLTNLYVSSLAIDNQGFIFAGTNDWIFSSRFFLTNILQNNAHVQKNYFLSQNYPNPFSTSTAITYRLSSRGPVRLEVFDLLGRKIATVVDEEREAGEYSSKFSAGRFAELHPGVYFYRLIIGKDVMTIKMIVMQ